MPEGFNPRGQVEDDRDLERLADSIRRHGVLQPVRVRATEHGDYVLIAGERRYRAAVKAALMELPAIIRPAGPGDDDEEAALLMEAVLENDQRADLDPVRALSAISGCWTRGSRSKASPSSSRQHRLGCATTCGSSSCLSPFALSLDPPSNAHGSVRA